MTISQRTLVVLLLLTVAPARVALSQEASEPSDSIGVPGKVREELAQADRTTSAAPTTDEALAVQGLRPSMDAELIRSIRPDWKIGQDADAAQAEIMDTPEVRFAQTTFAEMEAFDALRDRTPASPGERETSLAPPLLTSFAGTADNLTFIPPDTHGAVGPDHVAELLNNGWQVFDKTGGVVAALVSHQSFWSALGTTPGAPADFVFDPRIIYDQHSGRWLATADSNPNTAGNVSWILVGISATSDPTGAWNLFAIDADATTPGEWADFPDLGVDADNVYVTNNMFAVGGGFTQAKFWVISKASMISGGPLSVKEFINGAGGSTYRACHSFDATAGGFNYLISGGWGSSTLRFIRVQMITGVGAAALLTDLGWVEVASYNFSQLDAPQPLCSTRIDSGGTRLRNAVMRNAKIWTTHSVGNGSSKPEVAWYEFDPTTASFGPFVMPIQQGRVADSSLSYYYPSIAVNKDECVALGFSGSDASTFVSGYYTLRLPTDPAGTMQPVNLLKAGTDAYWKEFGAGRNRWGDYSATVVDPVDDETFWTVQEYAMQQLPGGRLDVSTPASIAGTYNAPRASFGPPLTETGTTGDVALAEPNEACSAITNPGAVSGKVALVDRGSCPFSAKVKNCQDAGAIAVIVANNVPDPPFRMSAGTGDVITIPSVMVSQNDGATIRTEVGSGSTVNVRMYIVQPTVCESESGRWATWWGEFRCSVFCGDNVVNQASEECDGTDDTACPGACQSDCTCSIAPDPLEAASDGIGRCDHDIRVSCSEDVDCRPGGYCEPDLCGPVDAVCLGTPYNRVGDFKMPTSSVAGVQEVAIRVKLDRMHIDSEEDVVNGCPVRTESVCSHDSTVGCSEDDECGGVSWFCLGVLADFDGAVRYLGAPEAFYNNSPDDPKWVAAKLQCAPFYRDWSASALQADFLNSCSHNSDVSCEADADCRPEGACDPDGDKDVGKCEDDSTCGPDDPDGDCAGIGDEKCLNKNGDCGSGSAFCVLPSVVLDADTIYYYGAEVVPCSIHSVQQGTQSCVEAANEECFSAPLEVRTALWGDVSGDNGLSFTDINDEVKAFKGIPRDGGGTGNWRSMLRENEGAPGVGITFYDINKTVEGFKGIAYKEKGPTACP